MIVTKRAMKKMTKRRRQQRSRALVKREIDETTDRFVQKDIVNALVGLVVGYGSVSSGQCIACMR